MFGRSPGLDVGHNFGVEDTFCADQGLRVEVSPEVGQVGEVGEKSTADGLVDLFEGLKWVLLLFELVDDEDEGTEVCPKEGRAGDLQML